MKKIISIVLVLILIGTLITGCDKKQPPDATENTVEDTSLEDILQKGKLVVGLDDTFAPMGFRESDGSLVGFDIDLAEAVGEKLGINIEFQPISWDAKEMELSSGKIDCIWNGMSITPERIEQMSLSDAYLGNQIIVMTNKGIEIASKEDLKDYNIGVQSRSAALESVMNDDVYESIKDKIIDYPTYDEVILDLKTNRLDCMIIDQVFGEYKNANLGGIYGTADFDFGEDLYAIGFRKEDIVLTAAVNQAIETLKNEGVTASISETWFGKDIVLS